MITYKETNTAMAEIKRKAFSVHTNLIKSGIKNPSLFNSLIALYSKSSDTLHYSLQLFNNLPFKPTQVSWTSIISSFSASSPCTSFSLFSSMLNSSTLPNPGTVSSLLKTFHSNPSFCFQLHCLSLKLCLHKQPFSGSALVHFYAGNGLLDRALNLFDEITLKDEVCYGSIIVGLAQNRRPIQAITLFKDMKFNCISSSAYCVSAVLLAAGQLASLEETRLLHAHSFIVGLDSDLVVATALVDAYGKSGTPSYARKVFHSHSTNPNTVMWNALLSSYAQYGDVTEVKNLFDKMELCTIDEYTLLAVLGAFSNAGLAEETRLWLNKMESVYGVNPKVEHYTCLVSAFARVGQLEDAYMVVSSMPYKPDSTVWRTLLSGCMVHGSVRMGQIAAWKLLDIDSGDESAYIMLARIYEKTGKRVEMNEVLKEMRNREVKKEKSMSWVEVKGEVNEFVAGHRVHERIGEIYEKVKELGKEVRKLGYEEEDERMLYHSERLALAYGVLVSNGCMEELRVLKNLRICGGCHEFFKCVSKVLKRTIVVRDVNRYHRFEDGLCNCSDCW